MKVMGGRIVKGGIFGRWRVATHAQVVPLRVDPNGMRVMAIDAFDALVEHLALNIGTVPRKLHRLSARPRGKWAPACPVPKVGRLRAENGREEEPAWCPGCTNPRRA